MIEEAIDQGAARIELSDGATAAFINPAATGHMWGPLPGNRLIQISGEGNLPETLDYELSTLQPWMTAVRTALPPEHHGTCTIHPSSERQQ